MLEKGKNKVLPCGRNSVGALDSALSSILFGVCAFRFPRQPQALFKTAVRIFKSSFSQNHYFADFFDPTRCPKRFANHNDTRTKQSHNPYRPDAGPLIADFFFLRTLLVQDEQQASARHGRAQMFLNELLELKVEDVKTKLSCETSKTEWKMWKWSFRAWDFPQRLNVEDGKMKLSCETSLKNWKWKMWKWSFRQLWWWWQWWVIVVDVMW